MKKLINKILGKFGYQIINVERTINTLLPSMQSMLNRLKMRPLVDIGTVIDVGASDGRWSAILMPVYPNANYLLIDADQYHQAGLEKFVKAHPKSQYVLAAAGDTLGEIYFHIDDNNHFAGMASHEPVKGFKPVPVTTIDHEIAQRNLAGPYLIKLDTHGFEVQILEGAKKTLEQTNMLIIETYNHKILGNSLRFYELCVYLEERGFRVVDFYDPGHRENGVFMQIDFCFIRVERPEFDNDR